MATPALVDDLNVEQAGQLTITLPDAVNAVKTLERAGILETTGVALTLSDATTFEQAERLAFAVGLFNRSCSWWIGDLLVYSEQKFGETYAQIAAATGLAEQTLLNRVYVARHVPPSRRKAALPFSVHAEVAPLPAKEQRYWLDRAEKGGWTRAELRERMKARRRDEQPQLVDDEDPDDVNAKLLQEVALAILRDARPADDGQHHLIPNEDVARLRAALGQEE